MKLVYRQSTQIIQKQRIQIQHNRIKNPNWQEATSWLYQAWPRMWTRERLRTTGNPASGQSGIRTREAYCESYALTTWPALGGGGGVHFSEVFPGYASALELVNQYSFPWKGLLLSKGSRRNGKLRRVDFFFFRGGGGLGLKDMYVCTQWQGSLQRRESVCYRAWEWRVWECTPVLYSKVYFLTKVLHSGSHCQKRNSNTDDNQYLDEYSKPTIIWKCWLDNL